MKTLELERLHALQALHRLFADFFDHTLSLIVLLTILDLIEPLIYLLEGYAREAEKQLRQAFDGGFSAISAALIGLGKSVRNMNLEALEVYDVAGRRV